VQEALELTQLRCRKVLACELIRCHHRRPHIYDGIYVWQEHPLDADDDVMMLPRTTVMQEAVELTPAQRAELQRLRARQLERLQQTSIERAAITARLQSAAAARAAQAATGGDPTAPEAGKQQARRCPLIPCLLRSFETCSTK